MKPEYNVILSSAVGERDGMSVELLGPSGETVAEVFRDDNTGALNVSIFTGDGLPLAVVESLLAEAKSRLG